MEAIVQPEMAKMIRLVLDSLSLISAPITSISRPSWLTSKAFFPLIVDL
ncbi:MAG: hypothetical protein ABSC55_28535 [Syntrophorhabdales bacterium]|jgi:hypothetical protein